MESEINGQKTIEESSTTLAEIILPSMTNPVGAAHGGELLKMMDNAAGVCATRHSRSIAVTVGIDNVNFHGAVYMGELVTCKAHLTYTGRSSMEIAVSLYAENTLKGEVRCCLTAYYIFVALDREMHPVPIPQLNLENEREKKLFAEGEKRMKTRKEFPQQCWLPLY